MNSAMRFPAILYVVACPRPAADNSSLGVDLDGDGFPSIADEGQDCDDEDPSVHPGAVEECGDGVDQDCDGLGVGCEWAPEDDEADVLIHGMSTGGGTGGAITALAGPDGHVTLAIGAPDELGSGFVFLLPFASTPSVQSIDGGTPRIWAGEPALSFGAAIANAGDVDGNGWDDLFVTASLGGHDMWLVTMPVDDQAAASSESLITFAAPSSGWDLGRTVDPAPVSVESSKVLIAGASSREPADSAAMLFEIVPASTPIEPRAILRAPYVRPVIPEAPTVAMAADFDGDGLAEAAVLTDSSAGCRTLYLLNDPPSGDILLGEDQRLFPSSADECYGARVVDAGDADADGYSDLLVNDGTAVLLAGGPAVAPMDFPTDYLVPTCEHCKMFSAMAEPTDLDGDGFVDFILFEEDFAGADSAPFYANFFWGPVEGAAEPSAHLTPSGASHLAQDAALFVGDIDHKGLPDVVLGEPDDTSDGLFRGAVYLFLGPSY